MRARLAGLVVGGVLVGAVCGCNSTSPRRDGAAGGLERDGQVGGGREGGGDDRPSGVSLDVPAGADQRGGGGDDGLSVSDVSVDAPAGADQSAADQAGGGVDATVTAPVDSAQSCVTQTVVLARGGTTSACSFKVSSAVPRDRVNLSFGGRRLCRQGSNNCNPRGGWFWFGSDEVALCDATCVSWEDSRSNLVLEVGCPTESCFVACREEGGPCGDGINSCCVGWRCAGTACVACGRGGQACATNADCCTGSTCQNGSCIGGLGTACVSQAGCAQGECRDGRCQCRVDQILCNSGCVSYTDPNNCRGCGNVCAVGTGRVCTVNGCVCDPQSAFPDDCNGVCVNKSTDRNNCGYCSYVCPKLEWVCTNGKCGCPGGQTDCNGSCVDTSNSQTHCGMCNRGCPVGVEVCSGGMCVCAPGYTRCPTGNCVNLMTDKFNCSACGTACPGNRTCNNGVCG